jgi:hypothetical protein
MEMDLERTGIIDFNTPAIGVEPNYAEVLGAVWRALAGD